jgi:hypothetical protein
MAPAAGAGSSNSSSGGGFFAGAAAALRQCIAANYQKGAKGREAVLAAVQKQLQAPHQQRQEKAHVETVGEAVEMAFRQVLNEDLIARALPAGEDILVRLCVCVRDVYCTQVVRSMQYMRLCSLPRVLSTNQKSTTLPSLCLGNNKDNNNQQKPTTP